MKCFHCGLDGHQTSDCPKRDEAQTAEGKEVQKAFFRSRKVRTTNTSSLFIVQLFSVSFLCSSFANSYTVSIHHLCFFHLYFNRNGIVNMEK